MKRLLLLFIPFSLGLFSGCGKKDSGPSPEYSSTNANEVYTINGLDAKDAYNELRYISQGKCEDNFFIYKSVFFSFEYGPQEKVKGVTEINLFLRADGIARFRSVQKEIKILKGEEVTEVVNIRWMSRPWHLEKEKLAIDDVGTGLYTVTGNLPGLKLDVGDDLIRKFGLNAYKGMKSVTELSGIYIRTEAQPTMPSKACQILESQILH